MGMSIDYRSTSPVELSRFEEIQHAIDVACAGKTWLSCEPVNIFRDDEGHLIGGSKPNFDPHPDDVAFAAKENMPDGTTKDMLEILCKISREHGVDWELSSDYIPSMGKIHNGVADETLVGAIDAFGALDDLMDQDTLKEIMDGLDEIERNDLLDDK